MIGEKRSHKFYHFGVPSDHPKHQLYVDTSTAHMVLKGWRHIPRVPSPMQAATQPPPAGMELHAPSSVSCIDQEPYLQLNENASTFAAPQPQLVDIPRPDLTMTSPALHFDSTIHDPQIFVPSEEPGHVHQQEPATTSTSTDSSCAVSDQNYLHTLQGTESASRQPRIPLSPLVRTQEKPKEITLPALSSKPPGVKPGVWSALSVQEAMEICQHYHDIDHHILKATLLRKAILDETLLQSNKHVKEFVC
jgi:hypothetical protein